MKRIGILGAALFAVGTLLAVEPSIALHRVQQRYPWNGMVDIDYTVANVPVDEVANYYVRFTITENENSHVLHEFLDASTLYDASNGTYRVTWNSAWEDGDCRFFTKTGKVAAELVWCGGDKSNQPYGDRYVIIDLSAGTAEKDPVASTYPVTTRYFYTLAEATNTFNNASDNSYKTTKLVLRRIHAGTFTMGSPVTEPGREPSQNFNRETQHQVTLTAHYLIGIFPVTQAQWMNVTGKNPSSFTTDAAGNLASERPVEQVSYQMIRGQSSGIASPRYGSFDDDSFLGLLKRRTGLVFDLPTEAQWECACRAGTTTCTYVGDYSNEESVFGVIGWYSVNNIETGPNAYATTHGVGQKIPNPWGFYDMLGNVWDFCRDRLATKAHEDDWGSEPVTDPLRAVSGGNVALRGGSWNSDATRARAACRFGQRGPESVNDRYGFRLSRTLP